MNDGNIFSALQAGLSGIIPVQFFDEMQKLGYIGAGLPLQSSQFQPASLDLRLADRAWRVRASALPDEDISVEQMLQKTALHEIDISKGVVLEVGCVYVVALVEKLELPAQICAKANPKSSAGRLDIFVRLLCDYNDAFDSIKPGYCGALYLEISPQSFPILVRSGSKVAQVRFKLLKQNIEKQKENGNEFVESMRLLNVSVNLSLEQFRSHDGQSIIGYRARRYVGLIDIDAVCCYESQDFWEPIGADMIKDDYLALEPGTFYILVSREKIIVDLTQAAEMTAFDAAIGEFRVHYAGFFDPGFGLGECGSYAVLEVRSRDVPFLLRHGQIVGKLHYEKLITGCSSGYGMQYGSHYQGQRLKLSKHFK